MTDNQTEFRGWKIVGVAFAAQALAIGLTIIPYGLFIEPIVAQFGASVMTANLGLTLLTVAMTLLGPALGPVLDRYSIRLVMVLGALLISGSFALMAMSDSLLMLGICLGTGIAAGIAMLGPLASTTVVAKWFESKRGRAVGIAAMGPPAGGFLATPLAGYMIETMGWRATLWSFAGLVLLIIPFIWTIVRNKPEDLGQHPDGEWLEPVAGTDIVADESWSAGKIMSARNFWVLALAFGIVFGVGGGWNANFPKFAGDLGYGIQQASYFLALGAFMGIPGTLLFGALADRVDNRNLTWVIVAMQGTCFMLLWTGPSLWLMGFAVILFGMGGGGLLPVYASLIGRVFGPSVFGQVMGLAGLVMLPFGAMSPPFAGYLRDLGGNYDLTLLIFSGSFLLASIILLALQLAKPSLAMAQPLAGESPSSA